MRLARRTFIGLAGELATIGAARAAAADLDLEYCDGVLRWPGGAAPAAVGRAGVTVSKTEGDGATPAGGYPLVSAFYRGDRMTPPPTRLPLRALEPGDAWVDDPSDRNYNRRITLPYPAHVEPMWLDDRVYDLLAVIGYNMHPIVPGAGSAIFLHIARPNFLPTGGCIAVAQDVLLGLMPRLGPASKITVCG